MRAHRRKTVWLALALGAAWSAAAASADPGAASLLFVVDPGSGEATRVGRIEVAGVGVHVSGLAFLPDGRLVASAETTSGTCEGDPCAVLVEVDPATGAASVLEESSEAELGALAVDPVTGAVFGVDAIALVGSADCSAEPLADCTDAAKASVRLKARRGRLKVALKKLGDSAAGEFGTPTEDTGYSVCVYELDGEVPTLVAGYEVPAGAGWIENKHGFDFRDAEGAPDGITAVRLEKGGSDGARVMFGGKKGVAMPELPLASGTAIVQVVNDEPACFQAAVTAVLPEDNTTKRYVGTFPTPSPTATATPTASPSVSGTPSATPTATPSGSGSPSPTSTPTGTPFSMPTPTATGTPTPTATASAPPMPTPTATPTPFP